MVIREDKIKQLIEIHFPDLQFEAHEIFIEEDFIRIENRNSENYFSDYIESKYFEKINEEVLIYHYLNTDYIIPILKGKIRLYNLSKYLKEGDKKEYIHFINRVGLEFKSEEKISEVKDKTFILSLTNKKDSEVHFERFGEGNCACIEFNVRKLKYSSGIEIGKVEYESRLNKLFCLQQCLNEQLNLKLYISNFHNSAKFFKQNYYEWEEEIRLCYDVNLLDFKRELVKRFSEGKEDKLKEDTEVKTDVSTGYKFIELDLKNDYFELKPISIQLKEANTEIIKLCKEQNIKVEIIK